MSGLFEQKLREIVAGLDPDSDQPSHVNSLYSFMSHSPELARLGVELVVDHLPYVDNRNLVRVIWRGRDGQELGMGRGGAELRKTRGRVALR